jgi:hypothetical protein
MRYRNVLLPDPIDKIITKEALLRGVDPSTLCSGIIAEHCLASRPKRENEEISSMMRQQGEHQGFDVHRDFPDFPQGSRELAQQFIDEALNIRGTRAFPSGAGVGFSPNFVWVERIKSQRDGVTLSFYGRPDLHASHPLLRKSRANWSRAYVFTKHDLRSLLPEIQKSYELKRGGRN